MLTCPSKYFLGVDCPGCGAQRSAISLMHGDMADSLALYPGLIPFLLFLGICALYWADWSRIKTRHLIIFLAVVCTIVLGHYALKMTGHAPWFYAAEKRFPY